MNRQLIQARNLGYDHIEEFVEIRPFSPYSQETVEGILHEVIHGQTGISVQIRIDHENQVYPTIKKHNLNPQATVIVR